MALGEGTYTYDYHADWGGHDSRYHGGWIPGVACDSQDRVYVYSRSEKPLNVYDRDGNHLATWGEGVLTPNYAHGIFIGADDGVFVTDAKDHAVYKFSPTGELLLTLGTPGQAGEKEGAPFNSPTDIAVASTGDIIVSDGYGNHHVHRYTAAGEHICTWGGEGSGPGQFTISHSVRLDSQDRVWTCDRENGRLQIFDLDGRFLDEWPGLLRPNNIYIDEHEGVLYVAELGRRIGIFDLETRALIASWGGGGEASEEPGGFIGGPHGIWLDSRGDIYAGEVELGTEGRLHKYVRRR
jgi:sugar lactone lactonase YvrE